MARRQFINATHDFVVGTAAVEERIMQIVQKLYDERSVLQAEVDLLRSKLNEGKMGEDKNDVGPELTSHELIESKPVEEKSPDLPNVASCSKQSVKSLFVVNHSEADNDDPVKKKSISDFADLLKQLYPLRLTDEEMIRLATLSKLRTEIDQRHIDMENGEKKNHIEILIFFLMAIGFSFFLGAVWHDQHGYDALPYLQVLGSVFKKKGATFAEFKGKKKNNFNHFFYFNFFFFSNFSDVYDGVWTSARFACNH